MEIATVDPRLRTRCSNYINELVDRMRRMASGSNEGTAGNASSSSSSAVRRASFETRKSLSKSGFKDWGDSKGNPSSGVLTDPLGALIAQVGKEWNLDFFRLSELTNKNVLPTVAFQLRRAFLSSFEALPIDNSKWSTYVREICIRYRKAPYHNERHAGTVAHMNVWLLRQTACWTPRSESESLLSLSSFALTF
ncbi:hypothetical protein Efla_006781 [Eimeria flavescens]